ncbi:TPA: hypothetical protein HA265_03650, partial [Candidatus Woesearchaeota archaeon]|nr:hypothetical protein [Candidatus Woesearchaeota archaeon]
MNASQKILLIFLVLTISAPLALAESSIFHDDIISGHSIDIDDDYTFIITLNKYANKVFVNGGDIYQSIPITECKTLGEIYRVCFYNVTWDETEEELYAEVEIFRKSPTISVTKTINQTELYIGQEAIVTLTIKNTGDNAEKVTLLDDYSKEIKIIELDGPGCFVHENTVSWSGHLDTDREKTCTFHIYATEEVHKKFAAKVRYWTGLKWETEYTASISIDVEPVVVLEYSVVREDFEVEGREFDFDDTIASADIGEEPRIIIRLTNNYHEDVDANLQITLPEGVDYLQTSSLRFNFKNASGAHESASWSSDRIERISSKKLRWSGTLTNKTKTWVLKLGTRKSGMQNIILDLDYLLEYDYGESTYSELGSREFSVADPGIVFHITVDDQSKLFSVPKRLDEEDNSIDIQSMHPYRFTVYAQNTNSFSDIKDIRFFYSRDKLADFKDKSYKLIEAGKQVIPWSLDLIPPELYTDKSYTFNFTATYTNAFGEKYLNTTEFEFNVRAFEPIEINHDAAEGFVLESREKTMFTVSLDNQRVAEIKDIFVKDIIPEEFEVIGVTSNKLKLIAEEESEVYKYEITPPVVFEKKRFNITTVVSYFDKDLNKEFNYNETSTITVIPREPSVDFTITFDEPETIYPGNLIPATLTINNQEELELIRDITIRLPIQRDIDVIGPKTLFIDRIEPEESVELKNMVWFRPKVVNDTLDLDPIVMEYYDQYGSKFYENITDESFEVEKGLISGPAVFLSTKVATAINISEPYNIILEARNLGNEEAVAVITMGDKEWSTTIPPKGLKSLEYPVRYTTAGNYTLPAPQAKIDYHGRDMYTGGSERTVEVKLLLPEMPAPEVQVEAAPVVEAAPPGETASMADIEQTLMEEKKKEE